MGCSADDAFAAERSEPLDADAADRARTAFERIVSSSPTAEAPSERLARRCCPLPAEGSQAATEVAHQADAPADCALPVKSACGSSSRNPSQSLTPSEPPTRFNRASHSANCRLSGKGNSPLALAPISSSKIAKAAEEARFPSSPNASLTIDSRAAR